MHACRYWIYHYMSCAGVFGLLHLQQLHVTFIRIDQIYLTMHRRWRQTRDKRNNRSLCTKCNTYMYRLYIHTWSSALSRYRAFVRPSHQAPQPRMMRYRKQSTSTGVCLRDACSYITCVHMIIKSGKRGWRERKAIAYIQRVFTAYYIAICHVVRVEQCMLNLTYS